MRTAAACAAALVGLALVTPVLLVMAAFWAIAACTRAVARLREPAYLTRDQLIEFDPVFGWRPRANLETHHLMGDLFRIATDADGWRGRATLEESDVVVFGDSFAAGYGVSEEHLFANLPQTPRIKPIGIGGYSMVQELLWMKTLAPRLQGKLVVWFIYFGNDLYDNVTPDLRGFRKPFVREVRGTSEWEIVGGHVGRDKWPITPRLAPGKIHMAMLAELCTGTFLAQRAYRASEYLLREGRELCAAAGADLVVLTVPDPHQLSPDGHRYLRSLAPARASFDAQIPDREVEASCRRLGVPVIAGASVLDPGCYKKNDCHWNEAGHRRIARLLSDVHARRRPLSAAPGPRLANLLPSAHLRAAVKPLS